jgi:outer membrane protein OmpA-like peptidoglycan-associated protein
MEGRSRTARALAVVTTAMAALGGTVAPRTAHAQTDPRRAADLLEPSERGSDWLANESLDLRGHLRPSIGYVLSEAHRSGAPLEDLAFLHVGGSVVVADRLRLSVNLPFQIYAGGKTATVDGVELTAPPKESGVGDLRLGVDLRLFGQHRSAVTGALGLQLWAPTGQRSQWTSDGVFRARPRLMFAGELGPFVWAGQLGVFARERSEMTGSVAAGVRIDRTIVVGPELMGGATFDDAFAKTTTPVEALLGAHWLIDGTARLGGGLGAGLTDSIGAPAWRAILSLEWAPEIPKPPRRRRHDGTSGGPRDVVPDADHDGIPDAADACPDVVGIATSDPRTNGCPPDTDGDGIDDIEDACPTVRGIPSTDPATNGCPDRDRDHDGIPNELDACPDDRGTPDIDPARNGCPKAVLRGERIDLLDPIEFKPGTAELALGPQNESVLTDVLAVVLKLPEGRRLRIEGYTDNRGDPKANRTLSAARAAAAATWLALHGIDRARISTEGFGQERPLRTNETEAGRAENRRLELHLE